MSFGLLNQRKSQAPDNSPKSTNLDLDLVMNKIYGRESMEKIKARKRAEMAAGREKTNYVEACDDIYCNLCRKRKDEKSPWNK